MHTRNSLSTTGEHIICFDYEIVQRKAVTIEDYSSLFATIRHYSHCAYYSLFATIRCSLFATIRYSLFGFSRHPRKTSQSRMNEACATCSIQYFKNQINPLFWHTDIVFL